MRPTEISRLFGARVDQARKEKGWSKAELARQVGMDYQTVVRWITGQRVPREEVLTQLAAALGKEERFFFRPLEMEQESDDRVRRFLLDVATGLMGGESAATVIEDRLGLPLSAAERQQLAAGSAAIRQKLMDLAGRAWDSLTEEEQMDVWLQVAAYAARRSNEGHHGGQVRGWDLSGFRLVRVANPRAGGPAGP